MIRKNSEWELIPALGCTEPMAFACVRHPQRASARGAVARIGIEASAADDQGRAVRQDPAVGGRR